MFESWIINHTYPPLVRYVYSYANISLLSNIICLRMYNSTIIKKTKSMYIWKQMNLTETKSLVADLEIFNSTFTVVWNHILSKLTAGAVALINNMSSSISNKGCAFTCWTNVLKYLLIDVQNINKSNTVLIKNKQE
jgi:hypothetical protein